MCLGVFVASDQPLGLVPWDGQAPAFNVVPLSEHEGSVRRQFTLANIVYAGAHTGCSCGFHSDENDPAAVARSRAALIDYLSQVSMAGPVEVFVCWEGEYEEVVRARTDRAADSLGSDDDWLQELAFTRISTRAA